MNYVTFRKSKDYIMWRTDKKSKRSEISSGTFGVRRPRKVKKKIAVKNYKKEKIISLA